MTDPDDVVRFWTKTHGPEDWYAADAAFDAAIRDAFGPAWRQARDGGFRDWLSRPRGALAYLVLTDQFPRNMFRGSADAFATDDLARRAAKQAIRQGFDLAVEGAERQFFYLPLEHSESGPDQHRAVRLIATRLGDAETLRHARAHREVIRRYGRFPYRNAALGRRSTPAEDAMIAAGGYGGVLRSFPPVAD